MNVTQLRVDDPKAVSTIASDTKLFALLQNLPSETILNFPLVVMLQKTEESTRIWRAIVDSPEYSGDEWRARESAKAAHDIDEILKRSNIHPDFLSSRDSQILLFGPGLKAESVRLLVKDPAVRIVEVERSFEIPDPALLLPKPVGLIIDAQSNWPDLDGAALATYNETLTNARQLLENERKAAFGAIKSAVVADEPLHDRLVEFFDAPFEGVVQIVTQHGTENDQKAIEYFRELKKDFSEWYPRIRCQPEQQGTSVGLGDGLVSDARDGLAHYLANIKESLHAESTRGLFDLSPSIRARHDYVEALKVFDDSINAVAARLKEIGGVVYRLETAGRRLSQKLPFPDLNTLL